jgi:4-amino-4-deoxychorismate lyase
VSADHTGADRGQTYGDGLFETMRVAGGRVRYFDLHHARLAHGLRRLGIEVADLEQRMLAEIARCAEAGGCEVLKLIVTAGVGAGYGRDAVTVGRILTETRDAPSQEQALRVGRCATRVAWEPDLVGMKHLGRLPQVLARREVLAAGWDEGLMADPQGAWVSGTQANLFIRAADDWLTPRLDRGGVAGVMRRVLISILKPRLVRLDDRMLAGADRMFLCNAVRGVQWVSEFDGRTLEVTDQGRTLSSVLAPWRMDT